MLMDGFQLVQNDKVCPPDGLLRNHVSFSLQMLTYTFTLGVGGFVLAIILMMVRWWWKKRRTERM